MNRVEYETINKLYIDMDALEAFEYWECTDSVISDIIESIAYSYNSDNLDDLWNNAVKLESDINIKLNITKKPINLTNIFREVENDYYVNLLNTNLKALIVNWSIRAIKEYSLNIPVENEADLLEDLKYGIEDDNTLGEVFEMVAGYHVRK